MSERCNNSACFSVEIKGTSDICVNVHAVITAQTKQIKSDYEIKLKQQEIVQEVGNANMLTKALIDRLINKVYVFPGDRIEIEYATQDFLETKESEKEV